MSFFVGQTDIFVEIAKAADRLGVIGLFIFAAVSVHRKWLVPGWVYRESEARAEKMEGEKDAWRDIALDASNVASGAFIELKRRS